MKRYWLPPGAGGRVFGTRQPPSIQGDSTQLQRLFYSLAYSADKSWRSAESRMLQLIPPGTEMCSSSSAFWERAGVFFLCFVMFFLSVGSLFTREDGFVLRLLCLLLGMKAIK